MRLPIEVSSCSAYSRFTHVPISSPLHRAGNATNSLDAMWSLCGEMEYNCNPPLFLFKELLFNLDIPIVNECSFDFGDA